MRFLTVLKPGRHSFQIRVQSGVRGVYFNDFEYYLTDNPKAEGVGVAFAHELGRCFPRQLWPDVEIGARNGWEQARARGVRLCCVRFTMLFAKSHDVDTTPRAVQLRVAECMTEQLVRQAEPITPLRNDWLTSDVVALARGIHASAALDGLPALHDALLEVGCDDPLVIEHLQSCTDHTPSCWVVEMILDQAAARDESTSG